jgi:hypothetical protein
VGDVLTFKSLHTFDRIIAVYNSFCMIPEEADARRFFSQLDTLLSSGGVASLNYFHHDYWAKETARDIIYQGKVVHYYPNFDLSQAHQGRGVWIDEYKSVDFELRYEYPTRVYHGKEELDAFLSHTHLELVGEVKGFNRVDATESEWVDYILRKKR